MPLKQRLPGRPKISNENEIQLLINEIHRLISNGEYPTVNDMVQYIISFRQSNGRRLWLENIFFPEVERRQKIEQERSNYHGYTYLIIDGCSSHAKALRNYDLENMKIKILYLPICSFCTIMLPSLSSSQHILTKFLECPVLLDISDILFVEPSI